MVKSGAPGRQRQGQGYKITGRLQPFMTQMTLLVTGSTHTARPPLIERPLFGSMPILPRRRAVPALGRSPVGQEEGRDGRLLGLRSRSGG